MKCFERGWDLEKAELPAAKQEKTGQNSDMREGWQTDRQKSTPVSTAGRKVPSNCPHPVLCTLPPRKEGWGDQSLLINNTGPADK